MGQLRRIARQWGYDLAMRHVVVTARVDRASFGLALRKNGFTGTITGVSSARPR